MSGPRFTHVREIHLQNIFNQNNLSERLNGEFEDRFKCTRGLKSKNPSLIHLVITNHNFFREHEGLKNNMTPAEAIGIDIMPVPDSDHAESCDRWITFIENAAIYASSA